MNKEKMREIVTEHLNNVENIATAARSKQRTDIYECYMVVGMHILSLYYELFGYKDYQNDMNDGMDEETLKSYIKINQDLEEALLNVLEMVEKR